MTTAAAQTVWAELIAATLADAGVTTCVISPGSRSTPLVAALAAEPRLELVTIIDERAAAFFALGAARATGVPTAVVCTSGTAAAHYLPAIVEASLAGVPLVAITADRPPELQACGASQTIDQVGLYGTFVRGAFDLGAPAGTELALRSVRRKLVQAITLARGPHAGPVHLEVPLRKPLEPAAPSTDDERNLAAFAHALRGPVRVAPPTLAPDAHALDALAAVIAAEPDGIIVAGAMPAAFAHARDAVFALAARAGYPIIAEAGSQLRFAPRPPGLLFLDHADLIPLAHRPAPRLILQFGADPVAPSWPVWLASLASSSLSAAAAARTKRVVLAGATWFDPDNAATQVVLGDVALALDGLATRLAVSSDARTMSSDTRTSPPSDGRPSGPIARTSSLRIRGAAWLDTWRDAEARAAAAMNRAIAMHARNEAVVVRAAVGALPPGGVVQIGNSLPIRVVDQACGGPTDRVGDVRAGDARADSTDHAGDARAGDARAVITQRGAAGIDGLIASAAGATSAGRPVLLVLGDVSFAHDVGGLLAARSAAAPLAVLVIDNGGGQIFSGLPVARANLGGAFERHFTTAPALDPTAVAAAFGARALSATSPDAVAAAVMTALATPGLTVIHAPVSTSGAHDVRRTALELFTGGEHP